MYIEIELSSVLTPEISAMLDAHNLRAVGVALMVEPTIPEREYHIVKIGETLTSIAKEHNTTVKKLIKLNELDNPNLIKVGQIIFLN